MAEVPKPAIMARANPFRTALGLDVSFPAPGEAEIHAPPRAGNLDGDGLIAQGVVLTLLDVALGHAIASRLPDATSFATVSLQILIAGSWSAGPLKARGTAEELAADWRETTAMGRVFAPGGGVVATAQGCFVRGVGPGRSLGAEAQPQGQWPSFRELLGCRDEGACLAARVEQRHLNPDGVMHGGAMAALLDEGMRAGLRAEGAGASRLGSFSVRYLLPARPGSLRVTWQLQRRGRRIHFASASAADADGQLLATADATYVEDSE